MWSFSPPSTLELIPPAQGFVTNCDSHSLFTCLPISCVNLCSTVMWCNSCETFQWNINMLICHAKIFHRKKSWRGFAIFQACSFLLPLILMLSALTSVDEGRRSLLYLLTGGASSSHSSRYHSREQLSVCLFTRQKTWQSLARGASKKFKSARVFIPRKVYKCLEASRFFLPSQYIPLHSSPVTLSSFIFLWYHQRLIYFQETVEEISAVNCKNLSRIQINYVWPGRQLSIWNKI